MSRLSLLVVLFFGFGWFLKDFGGLFWFGGFKEMFDLAILFQSCSQGVKKTLLLLPF